MNDQTQDGTSGIRRSVSCRTADAAATRPVAEHRRRTPRLRLFAAIPQKPSTSRLHWWPPQQWSARSRWDVARAERAPSGHTQPSRRWPAPRLEVIAASYVSDPRYVKQRAALSACSRQKIKSLPPATQTKVIASLATIRSPSPISRPHWARPGKRAAAGVARQFVSGRDARAHGRARGPARPGDLTMGRIK